MRLVIRIEEGEEVDDLMRSRMRENKAERTRVETELAALAPEEAPRPHPAAAQRYLQMVRALREALGGDETPEKREARAAVRDLIAAVHVMPLEGRGQYRLEIQTELAPVLLNPNEKSPLAGASSGCVPELGAGTRTIRCDSSPTFKLPA